MRNSASTRREMLVQTFATAGLGASAAVLASDHPLSAAQPRTADLSAAPLPNVRYCLNTSTIRGQKLPLDREIELVAAAGYDGIEPWIGEIREYVSQGGSLADLRKKLDDLGLRVEDAIGFATWIVDDPAKRSEALETLKSDMELVRELGGTRIAAPPAGATNQTGFDLDQAAARYAAALDVGQPLGVIPQLELWGFSQTLSRLGELAYVAVECGHAQAGLLLDIYHIYKGGSDFQGLSIINGGAVHVLHMNDYPDIPRESIGDADRVYPGQGVAPVSLILRQLFNGGFAGVLSLELFNRDLWQQPAESVLREGLRSMQAAVADSLSR